MAEELEVKEVAPQHAQVRALADSREDVREQDGNDDSDEDVRPCREAVDDGSYEREADERKCVANQEPPFPAVGRCESQEVGYQLLCGELGKAVAKEGVTAVSCLVRKEEKTDRDENEEYFPVGKIEFFQSQYDIVFFPESPLVHPVPAKEEEHRDADFPKESQIEGRGHPENREEVF